MVKPLNFYSDMPQMDTAFQGWMTSFALEIVTQSTDANTGFVSESLQSINFKGTIQPLSPEEIALKPDGQRSWEWLQIHVIKSNNNLKTNDKIRYNGRAFKIMAVKDYSLNNYIEYHLVADYE